MILIRFSHPSHPRCIEKRKTEKEQEIKEVIFIKNIFKNRKFLLEKNAIVGSILNLLKLFKI